MTAEKKRTSADVQKELEAATRTANKLKATSITLAQRLDAAAAKGAPVKKISAMRKSITDTDKNVKWALKRVEAITQEFHQLQGAEKRERERAEHAAAYEARIAAGDIYVEGTGWVNSKAYALEQANKGYVWSEDNEAWIWDYQKALEFKEQQKGNSQNVD
jgi:hypothetical protein